MRRGEIQGMVGIAGSAASLVGFFWYGVAYHVFGGRILADVKTFVFFGWIVLAAFWIGFAGYGVKGGLKVAGHAIGLMVVAFCIGLLTGHYR